MTRIEKLKEAIEKGKEIGPQTVMISPTDRCNLQCRTCWRMDKDEKNFEKGLSLEKIKEVLEDCKELEVEKIDFTGGGEPFFRSEIFEILGVAKSHGFEVSLTTNSTLLDKNKIEKLVEIGVDELMFSIDGLEDANNYIRGKGTFYKILEMAKILEEERDDMNIGFSTVLTKRNIEEISELVKLAEDLSIDYVNFLVMNRWDSNEELMIPKNKTGSAIEKLKGVKKLEINLSVSTNAEEIIKHGIYDRKPPEFCFAPWQMAFINASGEVMACCTLASYYKNLLGNVKDESFYSIWNSEAMENFRDELKKGDFHEKCKECLPGFIERYNRFYSKINGLKR